MKIFGNFLVIRGNNQAKKCSKIDAKSFWERVVELFCILPGFWVQKLCKKRKLFVWYAPELIKFISKTLFEKSLIDSMYLFPLSITLSNRNLIDGQLICSKLFCWIVSLRINFKLAARHWMFGLVKKVATR